MEEPDVRAWVNADQAAGEFRVRYAELFDAEDRAVPAGDFAERRNADGPEPDHHHIETAHRLRALGR